MTTVTTRSIDAAIFDLGGVVMRNGRHADLVRRFPPEQAEAALRVFLGDYAVDSDHPWHRLERGEISLADCQALNAEAFKAAGIELPPRPAPQTDGDAGDKPPPAIAFDPDTDMIELIRQLRAAGLRTSILTNNVREFRDLWRTLLPFEELFDDIVDSHEVGMRKPNRAIYELALTRLSVGADRAVFLDDVATNVDAATSLGMFGVVVGEDSAAAIAEVERLAGLG